MITGIVIAIGWIWGVKALFSDPFVFGYLGAKADASKYKIFFKPLILCPPCMSSVHGTLIYFYLVNEGAVNWFLFCIVLCGFNYLIKEYVYTE